MPGPSVPPRDEGRYGCRRGGGLHGPEVAVRGGQDRMVPTSPLDRPLTVRENDRQRDRSRERGGDNERKTEAVR